jgi:hypothetical protein
MPLWAIWHLRKNVRKNPRDSIERRHAAWRARSQAFTAKRGITVDPIVADALSMRRFCVRDSFRAQCIQRGLLETLLSVPGAPAGLWWSVSPVDHYHAGKRSALHETSTMATPNIFLLLHQSTYSC